MLSLVLTTMNVPGLAMASCSVDTPGISRLFAAGSTCVPCRIQTQPESENAGQCGERYRFDIVYNSLRRVCYDILWFRNVLSGFGVHAAEGPRPIPLTQNNALARRPERYISILLRYLGQLMVAILLRYLGQLMVAGLDQRYCGCGGGCGTDEAAPTTAPVPPPMAAPTAAPGAQPIGSVARHPIPAPTAAPLIPPATVFPAGSGLAGST